MFVKTLSKTVQLQGIFAFGIVAILFGLLSADAAAAPADSIRPRLFVLVVFDQMRGDYLSRWGSHFGEDGFRRLQAEGAWFQNCHYPYAGTLTGAGHASLMAGCNPSTHGIVANEWYDRATSKSLNCVSSVKHERIPLLPPTIQDRGKVSPELLKSDSFGDLLKAATAGQGRIVGLSFKDRSAVLPTGHKADACYWFDTKTGSFVTSTYYADQLHPWVESFNSDRLADRWFGKEWTRCRDDLDYEMLVGPDNVNGEGSGTKQGRTFPHPMTGGVEEPSAAYYQALYSSPFGNELLLALAMRAIDAEQLGADEVPDLLTISFSSNDAIGHSWGPDSQEVLDVTLRSDIVVQELLATLDAKVGKGRYLLALSADHGVCQVPEVAAEKGKDAGRVSVKELRRGAEEFLEAEFGSSGNDKPNWIEALSNGWFYFNSKMLGQRNISAVQAEFALSNWLRRQPGVFTVFTRGQLTKGVAEEDVLGQRVARSYSADRCGDVLIILKPHWLLGDSSTGTTHGSPYGYDSHVPLLVYGSKVVPGVRVGNTSPTAIAPIFASALGIEPAVSFDTVVPSGLFGQDRTE